MDLRALLLRSAGVALAYAAVGALALQVSVPPVHAGPIYPSAGIALAAVLVYGMRLLPAVWLGALLANVVARAAAATLTTEIFLISMVTALGAVGHAALGALLVRRPDEAAPLLDMPGACARFALFGGLLASIVSASIATAAYWWGGFVARADALDIWWTWWSGDAIGVLIGAPVALTLIAEPRALWRPRIQSVGLPLVAVTLLMGWAIGHLAAWERQRNVTGFRQDALQLVRTITNRFDAHIAALHATHGLFIASEQVSRDEFRATTAHWLATLPGLRAIGWSRRIRAPELPAFESVVRAAVQPDFRVFDRDAQGRAQPPSAADQYVVVTYIEPESGNSPAIGVNSLSVPAPRAAIERALASNQPVATAGFRLAQERADQIGVVVYLAARNPRSPAASGPIMAPGTGEGVVFVAMRMGDALLDAAPDGHSLVPCLIDATPGARVVRLAGPVDCERPAAAELRSGMRNLVHEHAFAFAGRQWLLRVTPTDEYLDEHRNWTTWTFSVAGLLSIGLLGAFLLVASGRTRRIELEVAARTADLEREMAERRTKEAALRESEERFRNVFETASVGLTYVDMSGRLVRANPRFCEIVGRSLDELQRMTIAEITHPDDRAEDARLWRQLTEGASTQVLREKRYLHADGHVVPVSIRITLERDAEGRAQRMVGVVEDVSERHRLQEAERGRQAAEAANRAKSEFLSRMSHELRTPLNAMLGFAQLLDLDRAQPLSPTQADRVRQIQTAGWHLLDMINDVLDLSRIEAGSLRLRPEPLDLHALVDECISMQREDIDGAGLTVETGLAEDARWVRGDVTRTRQILANLLSNAIKYNRPGGSIRVSTARVGADLVALRVADTGIGMSAEQIAHLFEPFNRLGQERSGREGTGIGLVIARRLADLMDGRLEVESRVAVGSTFSVVLPATDAPGEPAKPAAAEPPAPPAAAQEITGRVLYIEDNAANAALIRGVLAVRPGVELEVCDEGLKGIAAARARRPDLVLLDLNLPDIGGLDVLATLKSDPQLADVPVIVVSANAMDRQVREAMLAGAASYITKPLRIDDVLEQVDAALRR